MKNLLLALKIWGLLYLHGTLACNPPSRNSFTSLDPALFIYKVGDEVTYKCFSGHERIEGDMTRRCLPSLRWSGSPLTCERSSRSEDLECPPAPLIDNGRVHFSEGKATFLQGDTITYTCNRGFRLIGKATVTCNENEWSLLPTCQERVLCNHRIPPQNTRYVQHQQGITKWYSGNVARFVCDRGYELVGRSQSRCLQSRRWSSPLPSCQQQERDPTGCNRPFDPENGRIRSTPQDRHRFTDGLTVVYECNAGFSLSGSPEAVCVGGRWSNEPICQLRVTCPHRQVSDELSYHPIQDEKTIWLVGDVAIFNCPSGYNLLGNRRSRCLPNGRWSANIPTCQRPPRELLSCERPENPVNGEVISEPADKFQFFDGETVQYKCDEGFLLEGDDTPRCENGVWSTEPKCRPMAECRHRPAPENGAYIPSQAEKTTWQEGETAVFNCEEGFSIAGEQSSNCQSTGEWSNEVPECATRAQCPHRDPPLNGEYVREQEGKNVWYAGELARYVCASGYMVGGSSAICTSAGTWTNPVPFCKTEITCPPRPAPENGFLVGEKPERWAVRSVATYRCRRGYNRVGSGQARCSLKGEWSSDVPVCTEIPKPVCQRPSNPSRGRVVSSPSRKTTFDEGESVTYQCHTNYELIGDAEVTCINGEWSHRPSCLPLGQQDRPTCERPLQPENGRLQSVPLVKRIFQDREFITYICNVGYMVVGDPRATCSNGRWSHEPTCLRRRGVIISTTRSTTTTARTTTASLRRRRPEPTSSHCFPRPPPVNGAYTEPQRNKRTWVDGEIARFVCNEGFLMNGNKRSICDDGVWSATVPTCTREQIVTPTSCERPLNPKRGMVITVPSAKQNFDDGEIVIFVCENGYEADSVPLAICRGGEWDRQPECKEIATNNCLNRPTPPYVRYLGSQQTQTTWRVGDLAGFECEFQDFQMFGAPISTCLSNGRWSSDIPTCRPPPRDSSTGCPRPPNPQNGKVYAFPNKGFFDDGDIVQVACNEGYGPLPTDERSVVRCVGNSWTEIPACEEL